MTLLELQKLYRRHHLIEAVIEPSVELEGWVVEFRHYQGGFVSLTDATGLEQRYNDVDSASEQAMKVGFHQVRIADNF